MHPALRVESRNSTPRFLTTENLNIYFPQVGFEPDNLSCLQSHACAPAPDWHQLNGILKMNLKDNVCKKRKPHILILIKNCITRSLKGYIQYVWHYHYRFKTLSSTAITSIDNIKIVIACNK